MSLTFAEAESRVSAGEQEIHCTIWLLYFFDTSKAIDVKSAKIALARGEPSQERFARPLPDYVRFEPPILTSPGPDITIAGNQAWRTRWRAYSYGVVSVAVEVPFHGTITEAVIQTAALTEKAEIKREAEKAARTCLASIADAVEEPHASWLAEEYTVVNIHPIRKAGELEQAEALASKYRSQIARLVRCETEILSSEEEKEIFSTSISYSPQDFIVVGWAAAVLYDTRQAAEDILQILEYANTQLLEFRHYDDVLMVEAGSLREFTDHRKGWWGSRRMGRESARLRALLLRIMELSDRNENVIRFVGDMYYARVYKLAAQRIGVGDYRALVDGKLKTLNEVYSFLVDRKQQRTMFLLEAVVVVILLVMLYFEIWGKPR